MSFLRWALITASVAFLFSGNPSDALPLQGEKCDQEASSTPYFRASGNEPDWQLSIKCGALFLFTDQGRQQQRWEVPLPFAVAPTQIFYSGASDLEMVTTPVVCHDTMTGMPYPLAVSLKIRKERLNGCGGRPVSLLTGQYWRVIEVAGETPLDPAAIWMKFDETGDVAGNTGCFRFKTRMTIGGEDVSFAPVATSLPMCEPRRMGQIIRFLLSLPIVRQFDLDDSGALLLKGDGQTLIKALRLPSGG